MRDEDEDEEDEESRRYYEDILDMDMEFADPGGRSALRAATPDNPRDRPCPSCGQKDVLTPLDVSLGYRCDACAERDEGHGP